MTEEFSVAAAAAYLSISTEAVHKAVREKRLPTVPESAPTRLTLAAVEDFHRLRQAEHIARLARGGHTPVSVAAKVRAALHHAEPTGLPRSFGARVSSMPLDWRSLFSKAELAAASVKDGEGCRWCKALEFAAFLGLRPTEYAPAYEELFGGPPCGVCAPGLLRPYMEALRARLHGGTVRPSAPPAPPSEEERAAAREWASQRAGTAAARPVQDDDGRLLVARRLRETRARLKDAQRRGEQQHALRLAAQVRDLQQDAAAVEYGRTAVTASARPGRLRCGHALAAGCGCPRRASTRGMS